MSTNKIFSSLLIIFLTTLQSTIVNAQKFSENTRLCLLNNEFDLSILPKNELDKRIYSMIEYARDYSPYYNRSYIPYIDDGETEFEFNNDLRDSLISICIRFKRSISKPQKAIKNLSSIYLDSLFEILNFKKVSGFQIHNLQNEVINNKNKNYKIKGLQLLTRFYFYKYYYSSHDDSSLEKAYYFQSRLIDQLKRDSNNKRVLLNELVNLSHMQFETLYNFYSYEKLLETEIEANRLSKTIGTQNEIERSNLRIVNTIGEMYLQSIGTNVLSTTDQQLLNNLFIKLLYKEIFIRKNKSNDLVKLNIIGRYISKVKISFNWNPITSQRCFLSSAILSSLNNDYSSLLSNLSHYTSSLPKLNYFDSLQGEFQHRKKLWELYSDLTALIYPRNELIIHFNNFWKAADLFTLLNNIRSSKNPSSDSLFLRLNQDKYYIELCNEINLINKLPYEFLYNNRYYETYLKFAEIQNKIEFANFRIQNQTNNSKDFNWDSLYLVNNPIGSYTYLKSAINLPVNAWLWRYRSLLKGELDAKTHELAYVDSIEIKLLQLQKTNILNEKHALSKLKETEINAEKEKRKSEQKFFILLVASILILTLLIFTIIISNRRAKTRHEISKLKIDISRSNLNSHFIKNLMAGPIGAPTYQSRNVESIKVFDHFNDLLKNHYSFSQKDVINLEDELLFLNDYIFLEYLRHKEKFSTVPTINENISKESLINFKIPPLLLQPIVENAFKEIRPDINNAISVNISEDNFKNVIIVISDFGYGISDESLAKLNNYSGDKIFKERDVKTGLEITLDRIKLFNLTSRAKISICFSRNEPHGLKVELKLNKKYEKDFNC